MHRRVDLGRNHPENDDSISSFEAQAKVEKRSAPRYPLSRILRIGDVPSFGSQVRSICWKSFEDYAFGQRRALRLEQHDRYSQE